MIIKNCEYCNKEFGTYPHFIKKGQGLYCSRSCRNRGRLKKYPEIREINKRCFDEARVRYKRENHPSWKGGISTENELVRHGIDIASWRKLVFERDNYICQDCKLSSGNGERFILNAHHILSFSENKELRLDINNGITLCVGCHKKRHKDDTVKWGKIGREKQLCESL